MFKPLTTERVSRLIMDVCGLPGSGTTAFGLSVPGPVAYIDLDYGGAAALQAALAKGVVVDMVQVPGVETAFTPDQEIKTQAKASLRVAVDAIMDAYASEKYRSIVIDGMTDFWDVYQLSQFGKLSQNNKYDYGSLNLGFAQLMRKGLQRDNTKNVVTLSKVRPEWVGERATGLQVRDGWKRLGSIVDVELVSSRVNGTFQVAFGGDESKIRYNPWLLAGTTLYEPDNNFATVASMMVEGTTPGDWL